MKRSYNFPIVGIVLIVLYFLILRVSRELSDIVFRPIFSSDCAYRYIMGSIIRALIISASIFIIVRIRSPFLRDRWLPLSMLLMIVGIYLHYTSHIKDYTAGELGVFYIDNVVVAIAEEFLFRVLFPAVISSNIKNTVLIITISSFVFGIAHLVNLVHQPDMGIVRQAIFATVLGFIFHATYFKTRSFSLIVFLHFIFNTVFSDPCS